MWEMNTHSGQDYKHSAIASMQLPVGVFKASWAQMCFLSLRRAACPAPCCWRIYHRFVSFSTAVRVPARHLFNMLVIAVIAAFNVSVGDKKWKKDNLESFGKRVCGEISAVWYCLAFCTFCNILSKWNVQWVFVWKMNQSCWCLFQLKTTMMICIGTLKFCSNEGRGRFFQWAYFGKGDFSCNTEILWSTSWSAAQQQTIIFSHSAVAAMKSFPALSISVHKASPFIATECTVMTGNQAQGCSTAVENNMGHENMVNLG